MPRKHKVLPTTTEVETARLSPTIAECFDKSGKISNKSALQSAAKYLASQIMRGGARQEKVEEVFKPVFEAIFEKVNRSNWDKVSANFFKTASKAIKSEFETASKEEALVGVQFSREAQGGNGPDRGKVAPLKAKRSNPDEVIGFLDQVKKQVRFKKSFTFGSEFSNSSQGGASHSKQGNFIKKHQNAGHIAGIYDIGGSGVDPRTYEQHGQGFIDAAVGVEARGPHEAMYNYGSTTITADDLENVRAALQASQDPATIARSSLLRPGGVRGMEGREEVYNNQGSENYPATLRSQGGESGGGEVRQMNPCMCRWEVDQGEKVRQIASRHL